jgi:hypothetical protein
MRSIDFDMAALLSAAGGAAYDTGRDGRPRERSPPPRIYVRLLPMLLKMFEI